MSTKTITVKGCYRCPFATGMGGGDEMPSFPRCTVSGDKLIEASPSELPSAPPPVWCPLRVRELTIKVELDATLRRRCGVPFEPAGIGNHCNNYVPCPTHDGRTPRICGATSIPFEHATLGSPPCQYPVPCPIHGTR